MKDNPSDFKEKQIFLEEEYPIIELPALIKMAIVGVAFLIGLMPLVLPWHFVIIIFFSLIMLVAIFLDPYVGLLVFLIGSILHPVEFFAEALASLHLSRNLAFGILIVWILHIMVYRDFKVIKTKQNIFVMLFGVFLFLSSLLYFDYSFYSFLEFIKLLILYFLVINLVRNRTKLFIMVWGLVGLTFIACLIGIYQHLHGIGVSYGEGFIRIRGTALDPNDYAMHLVIMVPLIFCLFLNRKNIFVRIALIIVFVLTILNIIFTYSRGGLVGLVFVLLFSFTRLDFFKKRKIVGVILSVLILLSLIPTVPLKYWERSKSIVDFSDPAIQARLDTWKTGLNLMYEHPFRGVGLGLFQYEYLKQAYMSPDVKTHIALFAHNSYIQIGAESGIFCLLSFLGLIFLSLKYFLNSSKIFMQRGDRNLYNLSQFLAVSLGGYIVCSMFLTQAFLTMFWIIIPLSVVLKRFAEEEIVDAWKR